MLNRHLETDLAILDELPERLYTPIITLAHGQLQLRVRGLLYWRKQLLAGTLPDSKTIQWPRRDIAKVIIKRLKSTNLVLYTINEESLVDQILVDICTLIGEVEKHTERELNELIETAIPRLENKQKISQAKPNSPKPQPTPANPYLHNLQSDLQGNTPLDYEYADDSPQFSVLENTLEQELEAKWISLNNQWQDIQSVFQKMGTSLGRGWDLTQGVLVSTGWQEILRYRRYMENYPRLITIIDSLGRGTPKQQSAYSEPNNDRVRRDSGLPQIKQKLQYKRLHSEDPMFTQGIIRSDDIARMLPQEAALLGHPQLKMLWHAKRAERALLSYQVEGVRSQHHPEPEMEDQQHLPKPQQITNTVGPIIMCMDTSASMHGDPENLAKAISLEILRLANQQQRQCYMFSFSGPGQIVEQLLTFERTGLKTIISFLQQSFHGGTDIRKPIMSALEKIQKRAWRNADILLISDGRFPVPESIIKTVTTKREQYNLRIHGIAIGGWGTKNMETICQPVYKFTAIPAS